MSEQVAPEISVDQRIEKLEQEIARLARKHESHKEIADDLQHWIREFRQCVSSRTGLTGPSGPAGKDGRDASIRIIKHENKVQVLDENAHGAVAAEISVPAISKEQLAEAIKDKNILGSVVDAVLDVMRENFAKQHAALEAEIKAHPEKYPWSHSQAA